MIDNKKIISTLAGVILVIATTFAPSPVRATDHVDGAQSFVSNLADQAIAALTEDGLSFEERRDRTRAVLRKGFALTGIARFVLGRYWRRASDEERREYLTLFEEIVVNVSADRVARYTGQVFEVRGATEIGSPRADERSALVHSIFYLSDDNPVRLDWRVANKGEIYKITDVVFEGVSLATTYRDEIAAIVRQKGIDGLLVDLREMRDKVGQNETVTTLTGSTDG